MEPGDLIAAENGAVAIIEREYLFAGVRHFSIRIIIGQDGTMVGLYNLTESYIQEWWKVVA